MKRLKLAPLLIALTSLWIFCGWLLLKTWSRNDGHLIYILDDPYIHLAIAKNWVQYGVWGVTPYQWSSSSSSILWPLLLSFCFTLFGIQETIPLILNLLTASLLLVLINSLLNQIHTANTVNTVQIKLSKGKDPWFDFIIAPFKWTQLCRLLILLAFIILIPLPSLILTGMEHTLQLLIDLLFFNLTIQTITEKEKPPFTRLFLMAPLVTLIRYEGIFLILGCTLLLLFQRRLRAAISIALLGLLPLVVYGTISLSHGWDALPNSVLLKGQHINNLVDFLKIVGGFRLLQNIYLEPTSPFSALFLLLLITFVLSCTRYILNQKLWDTELLRLALFLFVMWCHLLFARVGHFFRYEAYLVTLGIYILACFVNQAVETLPQQSQITFSLTFKKYAQHSFISGLLLFAFMILGIRSAKGIKEIVKGTTNIYEQQYQMGLFLQTYYTGQGVAANDIGAINYLANIRGLDLYGLGSLEVAHHQQENSLTMAVIKEMTAKYNIQIAFVYESWFKEEETGASILPDNWIKVGEWTIKNNVAAADPTVSIYATQPSNEKQLIQNLRQFSPRLPKTVKQRGPKGGTMKLVIVESPAKAKKIQKYLGEGWRVEASYGHVRDLPRKGGLGINVSNNFAPTYEVPKDKQKTVASLRDAVASCSALYLAPDPDREGEAIAWHLAELLNAKCPVYRVTFNEITKGAIQAAFKKTRQIDMAMVHSQQSRRILDRLVGWKVSGILRLAFRESLSAGRVQSVALRLVVEREQEITAFTPEQSWAIEAQLASGEEQFTAQLTSVPEQGLNPKRLPQAAAQVISKQITGASWVISDITQKDKKRSPRPPFITSTLQQKASSQLKIKPKQTMEIAQKLYEDGHITYMRTDSPAVAVDAQQAARAVIQAHFPDALPKEPPTYSARGSAQEAHECIRPTNPELLPEDAPLSGDSGKLYQLIWTRFIQSQMKPATIAQVVVTIQPDELPYLFTASGNTLTDPGWLVLEEKETKDSTLPLLTKDQKLTLTKLETKEQWTKPPARYTEPTLIQALEKAGIGRPSTYASIMETIQERGYVTDTGKALEPTETGIKITQFLTEQFADLLNLDFTKQMEDDLDHIAHGEIAWTSPLMSFNTWLTKALEGAKRALIEQGILSPCPKCKGVIATLTGKYGEYQRCLSCGYKPSSGTETGEDCPECGKPLLKREGKHGEFVSCSGYPECKYSPSKGKETGESCPNCGKTLVEKEGKKGTFVGCSGYPECRYIKPTNTTGEKCPECGKALQIKKSKHGTFIGCSGYPPCKYIPNKLKD